VSRELATIGALASTILMTVLSPSLLFAAYSQGCFPMADESGSVEWYSVRRRAVFPISGIRVSRSLRKTIAKQVFDVTFDMAFEEVVRGCFRPEGNWLTEEFVEAYTECHREGWAHSAEVWRDGQLVGGIYGLAVGSCFSAESMFHREADASKVALWALVEKCRELGFTLFDAQIMNPHLASLGAYEVSAREYLELLADALGRQTTWGKSE
jgi:leucyl/phenylalanyl-tRNA--protein transferase